ncbi:hypothetical protein NPX13_g5045 [Xylaria arbuscula]|uniref:Rhodopsin domain-containing protein n=1 Tax=Xylaria arbuscula TaxID=114810 RepID=A0A9W8NF98_9PEZI|nr:hypothetical protein NPX13_g5045 [Xylaria arbuscula]
MGDLTPTKYDAILNLPGLVPPRGVVPKFDNPPNQNGLAIAVVALCASISTILVSVRLYTRLFCGLRPKLEDYLGLLAFNAYTFLTAYTVMMFFAKTAVLLEWIRIFVADRQRSAFFIAACALIAVNAGVYAAGAIATGLACIPREKLWHPWIQGKLCNLLAVESDHYVLYVLDVFTAFINLAIDLGIFLLPQKIIWKLQMSKKRKIGVSVLFSVGLIACASAAGRAYYTVTLDFEGDVTFEASPTFLFGYAEMTTVLMVFCIPSIPKAFQDSRLIAGFLVSIRRWTSSPSSSKETDSSGHGPVEQFAKQPDHNSAHARVGMSTEDTLYSGFLTSWHWHPKKILT